jgi:hypothetical protein
MIDILMTVGAALLSGLVMYFFGYRKADKARTVKETGKRLKDVKTAQEVRDEVETLDDTGLADRAAKWLHGNKH